MHEYALLSVILHICGSFWVKIAVFLMLCLHQLIVFKLRWYDGATRPIENTGTKIFSLVDLLVSLYTMSLALICIKGGLLYRSIIFSTISWTTINNEKYKNN